MAHHLVAPMKTATLAGVLFIVLLVTGCSKQEKASGPAVPMPAREVGSIVTSLQTMTRAANQDTLADTEALVVSVNKFLDSPNDKTRAQLQAAWRKAHLAFAETRALLIARHDDLMFQIDAWPIEPGFIDSLPQYPESGIVNDFTLKIDKKTLVAQNGITANGEICLGFHPIEYYAFSRPVKDFVAIDDDTVKAKIVGRRRHLLGLIATLLNDSVGELAARMNADLTAFVPRNDKDTTSDDRLVRQIVAGSRQLAHIQTTEAGLIVDKDEGHAQLSNSSLATLATEIDTESRLYAPASDLMKVLGGLDGTTTANLETTLGKLKVALSAKQSSAQDRARIPLMFAAMGHQFSDLERLLPNPAD